MTFRFSRSLLLALAVAGAACSSHKTPVPGKMCLLNTDCDNPLSCTFGKCHEACRADGDCPMGEICVFGKVQGADAALAPLRVCISDECGLNSMCPDGLVCGKDLRCRMECMEDRDCTRTRDRCVPGGPNGELVCAEPE